MDEHILPEEPEEQESLLDLNEIMQAFGVNEWSNLGPAEAPRSESLSLLVEIQGQRYILRERPEGLIEEDTSHRYAFRQFLRQPALLERAHSRRDA